MANTIQKYHIKAKKNLGQNFLVNDSLLNEVINQIDISNKNIIEVGPGYGALTEKILEKKPKSVTLIELDTDMIDVLESRIEIGELDISTSNFQIVNKDILKYEPEFSSYDVLANIPYYITSPILRHFFYTVEHIPNNMLILMQKDVADKILEGQSFDYIDGEKIERKKKKIKTSVLSLFVQKKAIVRELSYVPRESFYPIPKVDSSFLYFETHDNFNFVDDTMFMQFIKGAFAEQRKKLLKNLVKMNYEQKVVEDAFKELNLDINIRPEKLTIEDFCKLIQYLEV